MEMTRRDFLKATSAVAAALGISTIGVPKLGEAEAAESGPKVVWFQGQACTGCSVSLLNSIYYMTAADLVLNTIDLDYHPNLMAAAGDMGLAAAEETRAAGGYILVVEGAIPTKSVKRTNFCKIGENLPILDAVRSYAQNAAFVVAVGNCASYGGIPSASGNPTKSSSLQSVLGNQTVVNLPGCPCHPDWIIGTVAYIMQNGTAPDLDSLGRPTIYYGNTVHSACPRLADHDAGRYASQLGGTGCLYNLGCKGPFTHADCPTRLWNGAAASTPGISFCVQGGSPCFGCTENGFPDIMSPLYIAAGSALTGGANGGTTGATPPAGGNGGGTTGATPPVGGGTGGGDDDGGDDD